MKKNYLLILFFIAAFSPGLLNAQTFSGGSGTETEPYAISSINDMQDLSGRVNAGEDFAGVYFKLTQNLDYNPTGSKDYSHTPIGSVTNRFEGIFDGDNKQIINLIIPTPGGNTSADMGLFGYIGENGTVKNVWLTQNEKGGSISTAQGAMGSIAAYCAGTIENCYNFLNVPGRGTGTGGIAGITTETAEIINCFNAGTCYGLYTTGGIVGENKGKIKGCLNMGSLEIASSGPPASMYTNRGGIAGKNTGGEISDCYNAGNITGYNDAAGIASYVSGNASITACYNIGQIYISPNNSNPSGAKTGAIAANVEDGSGITSCYYDKQIVTVEGVATGGFEENVTGLLTTEMTPYSFRAFEGFDTSVWTFDYGVYPTLAAFAAQDFARVVKTPVNLYASGDEYDSASNVINRFKANISTGINWMSQDSRLVVKNTGDVVLYGNLASTTDLVLVAEYSGITKEIKFTFPAGNAWSFFEGEGTEASPYQVASTDDLKELARLVNAGNTFEGIYFRQTQNIDCNPSDDGLYQHTPIGDFDNRFEGVYDGNSRQIINLTTVMGASRSGLFGVVGEKAIVKNVWLTESARGGNIQTGINSTGTIAGQCFGRIENCYNYLSVAGFTGIGGITGLCMDGAVITGCMNAGNVYGLYQAGGIVGNMMGGKIEKCLNIAEVAHNDYESGPPIELNENVGGIAGLLNAGEIYDSYNSGWISGYKNVGGITGGKSSGTAKIENCYNTGQCFSASSNPNIGPIAGNLSDITVTNCYYDKQLVAAGSASSDGITGLLTSEMIGGEAFDGFDTDSWTFESGFYPSLKAFASQDFGKLAKSPVVLSAEDTSESISHIFYAATGADVEWTSDNSQVVVAGSGYIFLEGDITSDLEFILTGKTGNFVKQVQLVILAGSSWQSFTGEGTESNPYLISSTGDLKMLSAEVNGGNTFEGMYFEMTRDIDCKPEDGSIYSHRSIGGNGIGNMFEGIPDTPFEGVFNGKGYEIINLSTNDTGNNVGLFGHIGSKGVVRNVKLTMDEKGGVISSTANYPSNLGGIAGYCAGRIENCYNYIPVKGELNVGGIVGNASKTAEISRSVNAGTIEANNVGGGVIGRLNGGTIDQSVNIGNVYGKSNEGIYFGGLVAQSVNSGTISNSYNAGTVEAHSQYIGGIAGRMSIVEGQEITGSLIACYNVGQLHSNYIGYGEVGNISPFLSEGINVGKSYYDKQIVPFKGGGSESERFEDQFTGMLTSGMITGEAFSGFDSDIWTFEEGFYPYLSVFANEDFVRVAKSPVTLYSLSDGIYDTSEEITRYFTVSLENDVVWSADNDAVDIKDNGQVIINPDLEEEKEFILTATYRNFSKNFNMTLAPKTEDIFEGSGIESDPYRISSTDDLFTLTKEVNGGKDFKDVYFIVTQDIDCSDGYSHTAIGSEETPFRGNFDGDGYSIIDLVIETTGREVGFFGRIEEGAVVKNLTLGMTERGGYIKSTGVTAEYIGGIAGYSTGVIENCHNYLPVEGRVIVGGIAGLALAPGSITKSRNMGTVEGRNSIGGIVGETEVDITECFNGGEITATSNYAGGIAGKNIGAAIENAYNVAIIKGNNYLGGIAGSVSDGGSVKYAYNVGYSYSTANGGTPTDIGAITGSASADATFTGCYYDMQMVTGIFAEEDENNVTGILTGELSTSTALQNWDTSKWTFTQDLYPYLSTFEFDDVTKVAVSPIWLYTENDEYESRDHVFNDFRASIANNVIWVSNGILSVRENGEITNPYPLGVVKDIYTEDCTLTATLGLISKKIELLVEPRPRGIHNDKSHNILAYVSDGKLTVKHQGKAGIEVYDISGKLVKKAVSESAPYTTVLENAGLYIIKVVSDQGSYTARVIVK